METHRRQTYLLLIVILIKKIEQKIFNEQLQFSLNMIIYFNDIEIVPSVFQHWSERKRCCAITTRGTRCRRCEGALYEIAGTDHEGFCGIHQPGYHLHDHINIDDSIQFYDDDDSDDDPTREELLSEIQRLRDIINNIGDVASAQV